MTETAAERTFLAAYGSPQLQAAVGIDPESTAPLRKAGKNPLHRQLLQTRIAELRARMDKGGLQEAVVRAALYVGAARGSVDERGFETIRRIRLAKDDLPRLSLQDFKAMVREQFFLLLIDQEAALSAIPSLLPPNAEARRKGLAVLQQVVTARGKPSGEVADRMGRVERLFDSQDAPAAAAANVAPLQPARKQDVPKAS